MLSDVMKLLGHPFRLAGDGTVATVVQGSDGFLDQCIQTVVGTIVGEREMCWPYGVPDPAWHGLEASDIQACTDLFGPSVTIGDVVSSWVSETHAQVVVQWDRSSNLGGNQL